MANNFTAEVSSFFLKNGNSSIQSLPSNNPDVGNAQAGRKYRMRVKIFKTSAARTPTRPQSSTSTSDIYYTPQYGFGEYETFTMYSRPSAFGPECMFYNQADSLANNPSEEIIIRLLHRIITESRGQTFFLHHRRLKNTL